MFSPLFFQAEEAIEEVKLNERRRISNVMEDINLSLAVKRDAGGADDAGDADGEYQINKSQK